MSMADFAVTDTTPGGSGGTQYYDANGNPWTGSEPAASPQPQSQQATPRQQTYNPQPAPTNQPAANTQSPLTADQQSAKAILAATLGQYGLGALADKAWNLYLNGEPIEQVMLELRTTPEYKARFPGMEALAKKGHAISEADYIANEKAYFALGHYFDLPDGFVQAHIKAWIEGESSPDEIKTRLMDYQSLVYSKPPAVRDELSRLYGFSAGDQLAAAANPAIALPILEHQYLAAGASAGAIGAGYGALTRNEAEGLANYGVTFDQAQQGFGTLADSTQLFTPLAGDQGEAAITRDEQLGATFGGNAAARRRIQQRARKRQATFQEGGGFQQGGGFGNAQGT